MGCEEDGEIALIQLWEIEKGAGSERAPLFGVPLSLLSTIPQSIEVLFNSTPAIFPNSYVLQCPLRVTLCVSRISLEETHVSFPLQRATYFSPGEAPGLRSHKGEVSNTLEILKRARKIRGSYPVFEWDEP